MPGHDEGQVVEPAHVVDHRAEAEAEGEQEQHRVGDVGRQRRPDDLAPDQVLAAADRERVARDRDGLVHQFSRSWRPVSRRNTSSRLAWRCQ